MTTTQDKITQLTNELLDHDTEIEQLFHKETVTVEEAERMRAWQEHKEWVARQ